MNKRSFYALPSADLLPNRWDVLAILLVVGLIMLFCKLPFLNWLKKSLSTVGKMALTNYVMHSVFAMFIFTGVGFGLFGKLQRYELLYVVFSIWLFQMIISPIWLKYFQYGPLEWLWRYLSYLKKPAFKK